MSMALFAHRHFFLRAGGCDLAATCVLPATAVTGGALLILPCVEERKGVLPVFMQTARALAAGGIAALLFDFSGCGDSEGDFASTDPAAFESECSAALKWLAENLPEVPLFVIGARVGALLAARLADVRDDVAAAALWSPVSGKDFVRQLLQRRMVNDMVAYGKALESRAELKKRLQRGETVDLDGYPISGAFYAWLQDLQPLPLKQPVLVFAGGHDEKTAAAFCGSDHAAISDLRYPPFWNTVGHVDMRDLTAATVAWLRALPHGPAIAPRLPPVLPAATPNAELAMLGDPAKPLSVIWDLADGPIRGGALFLHGWSGDRTGPHRLFTRFARLLTKKNGFLCLRPDFIGRGFSSGASGDASIALMTENAQTALDALRERLPSGTPVTVIGICSGCKVALTLAARNPDIAKLLLWSPESMGSLRSPATGLRKTFAMLKSYARKLLRPETWRKLVTGKVQGGMVAKALVRQEKRSPEEAAQENIALKLFRSFRNPVLFVFGGSDPDAVGSRAAYERYCRANAIPHSTHVIPHAGHSFYSERWTRELFDASMPFMT